MTDANERIDRMEHRLDILSADVRALGHRVGRLEVLHEELRGEVRLIAEVQTHHGAAIEATRGDVRTIQVTVEALQGQVGGLNGQLGSLRGEVADLHGEVAGLREEVADLRGEVRDVRGEVLNLHGSVETMGRDVSALRVMMAEFMTFVRQALDDHGRRIARLEPGTSGA